ncbi:MAG TPA: hypothetical protein P5127_00095 [Oscillospiraceae bacterium]|jgi:hypothetical protein|nr:hypothetical protein [Oscillospiraceae bacterium]
MREIVKYVAPRSMIVNGYPSPCDCTDTTACAYCVQANLLLAERRLRAEEDAVKAFIRRVRKDGVRPSARRLGVDEKQLRRWIKSEKVPREVAEKALACGH